MYFTRKLKGRSSEKTSKFWVRRVGQSFELLAFVFSPISRASWSYISALVPIKKNLALCAAAAAVAGKPRPPELATYIVTVTSAAWDLIGFDRGSNMPSCDGRNPGRKAHGGSSTCQGKTGSCLGSCSPLMIWSFLLKSRQWSGMELQQIIKPLVSY